jgi:hypothetical protein
VSARYLQPIRNRRKDYERKSYAAGGRWSGFYTREQTVCTLACGCTKTFHGMSAPVRRTTCPNGHGPADAKAVAS